MEVLLFVFFFMNIILQNLYNPCVQWNPVWPIVTICIHFKRILEQSDSDCSIQPVYFLKYKSILMMIIWWLNISVNVSFLTISQYILQSIFNVKLFFQQNIHRHLSKVLITGQWGRKRTIKEICLLISWFIVFFQV
jgi:hypothetical protein